MTPLLDTIGKSLENANVLHQTNKVRIYVENEDDVPFWKEVFARFAPALKTEVSPVTPDYPARRGKENVLRFAGQANRSFLLCVDSDYDYLMNGKTKRSRLLHENSYIFQTYAYAIENYQCYAPSLGKVMIEATLVDREIFDFEAFMQKYSQIIYDLFLYSVYYELENQLIEENDQTPSHPFSISEFNEKIKLLAQISSWEKGMEELGKIQESVTNCLQNLPLVPENELEKLKIELAELGLRPENVYLFMQGHTLAKNVVGMFLNPIFDQLKNKKLDEINASAQTETEKENKRNEYKKWVFTTKNDSLTAVERILVNHKHYYDCFLMRKIELDIKILQNKY